MRVISKSDISKLINIKDTITCVEDVFVKYTTGETVMPQRSNISIDEHNGNMLFMPAYIKGSEFLGNKIVSIYPDNPSNEKKTIYSVLILNDAKTGEPVALMDGEQITAYRTGAVTGVAAKYLSSKDADTVSIWGAGIQAEQQLEAICAVRDIKRIFVFDINKQNRDQFVEKMKLRLDIEVVGTDEEDAAVIQSDILITATTSSKPVIKSKKLKPGTFISAVGGSTQQKQEIPEHILKASTIIVDGYSAAMSDAGDIIIPMRKGVITRDDIKGELGEVITGKVKRKSKDEVILFKSVGLAIQDMIVASHLYTMALEDGLGEKITV